MIYDITRYRIYDTVPYPIAALFTLIITRNGTIGGIAARKNLGQRFEFRKTAASDHVWNV